MINEAARILEDGVVATPGDVDLGMIMGTGFPPFRGGLLRYADHVGVQTIVHELTRYRAELGERFEPAPLLRRKAQAGAKFYAG
jgi:3-hydroxyacyl-CoA dehydrogenase